MKRESNIEPITEAIRCPSCESTNISAAKVIDRFPYGVGADAVELCAEIPVNRCASCGLEFSGYEAEQLRHEAVCRHLDRLTPRQVNELRASYGLSRAKFADVTRIGTATLARWESGELLQNAAMDNYMRLIKRREIFELLESGLLHRATVTRSHATAIAGAPVLRVLPERNDFEQRKRDAQRFDLVAA
jgi:putative zinc finger/helix-turn-helix YgiT family protein